MTNELVGLLFITIVSMYEHIYQLGEYIYYGQDGISPLRLMPVYINRWCQIASKI